MFLHLVIVAHPSRPDAKVYFVDGKLGAGIITLKKQAMKAGYSINEKRVKRGMQPRAVRGRVYHFYQSENIEFL